MALIHDVFTMVDHDSGIVFTDSLLLDEATYPPANLDALRQARFDAWKALVSTAFPPVPDEEP